MRKFLFSLLLALCVCLPALGQKQKTSMKTLESQRAQLEKEIATLNRQLAQNSKNSSEAMTSLTLVRSKISAREKLIAGCDQTLRMLKRLTACRPATTPYRCTTDASSGARTKTATAGCGTCTSFPASRWDRDCAVLATCGICRPK